MVSSAPQLFLTEGRDILVNPQDLIKEESIGHGGFSAIYQPRFRKKSGEVCIYVCARACVYAFVHFCVLA